MCEINPAHKAKFTLELFTSDRRISDLAWRDMVNEAVIKVEMELNKTGEIRCHIHEVEDEKSV